MGEALTEAVAILMMSIMTTVMGTAMVMVMVTITNTKGAVKAPFTFTVIVKKLSGLVNK